MDTQVKQKVIDDIKANLLLPQKSFDHPPFIVVFGLPYTGTTEVSRYLAERFELVFFSTDNIRLKYGLESGPKAHEIIYTLCEELLHKGYGVIFDGIHLGKLNRQEALEFGEKNSTHTILVHTTAPQEMINQRMRKRCEDPNSAIKIGKFCVTPEHFAQIQGFLEVPSEEEGVWTINTIHPDPEENLREFIEYYQKIYPQLRPRVK